MRLMICLALALVFAGASGCARSKAGRGSFDDPAEIRPPLIVTPAKVLSGRVVKVNPQGQFVVLSFQVGQMPALEQRLGVYRSGLKTGEVRVTGPQRDDKIVADLIAGEAGVGDEVRSE
jgi:hypothetical protein